MDIYFIRIKKGFQNLKALYELPITSKEVITFSKNYSDGQPINRLIRYYQFEDFQDNPVIDVVAETLKIEKCSEISNQNNRE